MKSDGMKMRSYATVPTILCFLFLLNNVAFGFSTHSTTISRTFDGVEAVLGEPIMVTVNFTNSEGNALRGFYYTEQIPDGLTVDTDSMTVTINGNAVSNYIFESGSAADMYDGCIPYRWVLETPAAFDENNPIPPNYTVEIVYSVSSTQEGTFHFDELHWVGYYPDGDEGQKAAFGHSEEEDQKTITYFAKALTVTVPENATEGDAVLSDHGAVGIPGTLENNLVVSLASDDTTELTIPSTVTISAGQTLAPFDLTIVDDSDVDGSQSVTVTASADGWTSASDTIEVQDNDNGGSEDGQKDSGGGCFIATAAY